MADAQFDLIETYDTAPQSDWFHYCQETAKPYVVVRTGENTADVMWDYVTLPPAYDHVLFEKGGQIQEQAIAMLADAEEELRAELAEHLDAYRAGRPWRE